MLNCRAEMPTKTSENLEPFTLTYSSPVTVTNFRQTDHHPLEDVTANGSATDPISSLFTQRAQSGRGAPPGEVWRSAAEPSTVIPPLAESLSVTSSLETSASSTLMTSSSATVHKTTTNAEGSIDVSPATDVVSLVSSDITPSSAVRTAEVEERHRTPSEETRSTVFVEMDTPQVSSPTRRSDIEMERLPDIPAPSDERVLTESEQVERSTTDADHRQALRTEPVSSPRTESIHSNPLHTESRLTELATTLRTEAEPTELHIAPTEMRFETTILHAESTALNTEPILHVSPTQRPSVHQPLAESTESAEQDPDAPQPSEEPDEVDPSPESGPSAEPHNTPEPEEPLEPHSTLEPEEPVEPHATPEPEIPEDPNDTPEPSVPLEISYSTEIEPSEGSSTTISHSTASSTEPIIGKYRRCFMF